jgi:hypothetical protein
LPLPREILDALATAPNIDQISMLDVAAAHDAVQMDIARLPALGDLVADVSPASGCSASVRASLSYTIDLSRHRQAADGCHHAA